MTESGPESSLLFPRCSVFRAHRLGSGFLSFTMARVQVLGSGKHIIPEIAISAEGLWPRSRRAIKSQAFGARGDLLRCIKPPRRVLESHVGSQRGAQLCVGTCLTGLSRLGTARAVPTLYRVIGCWGRSKKLMLWWLCSRDAPSGRAP